MEQDIGAIPSTTCSANSEAMRSERYDTQHDHHPELLSAIIELSLELQLLQMFDGWLTANHADQLHGTASEIERYLRSEYVPTSVACCIGPLRVEFILAVCRLFTPSASCFTGARSSAHG